MREIKFRAWDEAIKSMTYEPSVAESAPDHIASFDINAVLNRHEYLTFMQFTGLKDKNGKEIYEDDIVRVGEYEDFPEKKTWRVVYCAANEYPAFDLDGWDGETNGLSEYLGMGFIEVIGNIYENPELLKTN